MIVRRRWAGGAGLLFVISSWLPLIASVLPTDQHPSWLGPLDVATAGTLLLISLGPIRATSSEIQPEIVRASYAFYRRAAHALLMLLAFFFLLGDRVHWDVLLIGLAWRAWLLLYAFPFWLQAWRERQ
jgi:hypothetical protein